MSGIFPFLNELFILLVLSQSSEFSSELFHRVDGEAWAQRRYSLLLGWVVGATSALDIYNAGHFHFINSILSPTQSSSGYPELLWGRVGTQT